MAIEMTVAVGSARHELEARLDSVGWGLLFLVSGVLLLLPDAPEGSWLAGVGAILLIVSAAKWALGVKASWFTVILGGVALVTGLGTMAGLDVPFLALLLIACGGAMIVAQVLRAGDRAADDPTDRTTARAPR